MPEVLVKFRKSDDFKENDQKIERQIKNNRQLLEIGCSEIPYHRLWFCGKRKLIFFVARSLKLTSKTSIICSINKPSEPEAFNAPARIPIETPAKLGVATHNFEVTHLG
jgi:hypothetical protein